MHAVRSAVGRSHVSFVLEPRRRVRAGCPAWPAAIPLCRAMLGIVRLAGQVLISPSYSLFPSRQADDSGEHPVTITLCAGKFGECLREIRDFDRFAHGQAVDCQNAALWRLHDAPVGLPGEWVRVEAAQVALQPGCRLSFRRSCSEAG